MAIHKAMSDNLDPAQTTSFLEHFDDGEGSCSSVKLETAVWDILHQKVDKLNNQPRRLPVFAILVSLGILTTLTALMVVLHQLQYISVALARSSQSTDGHSHKEADTTNWRGCGSNSTAARSNGCQFDVMLTAWIHADCFDEELLESYLAAHNYTWYADSNLSVPVPDEVVRAGDHFRVYVEPAFHYVHCAYMWEMQMRAWHGGRAIEHRIWELDHTVHCGKLLVEHVLPHNYTRLTVAFDRCGLP